MIKKSLLALVACIVCMALAGFVAWNIEDYFGVNADIVWFLAGTLYAHITERLGLW